MNAINILKLRASLIIICVLLSSCSKDLFHISGSVQMEMDKAVEGGFDGMIVYVNQAGKSSYYSAGLNNREKQTLANPHLLFKIASISKLYIAAATAKLIGDSTLSLNQKLSDLIPEVNGKIQNANQITLKMLLQHRSGIPDYIYQSGFDSETNESYMTSAALIFDKPADFSPDAKYGYSNTNYLLIGEILDRKLGYSHHDFITNKILQPLGLTNTFNLYNEVDSNKVMSGYYQGDDPDLKSIQHTRPGGSMVATAEDVGTFLRALIDGTLFTEEEQNIYSDIYKYEHTGWIPGYTSIARYHSNIDAVVVQFVNTSRNGWFWIELERVNNRIVKSIENGN